jgi:hypothetical protein
LNGLVVRKGVHDMADILSELDKYIPEGNPRKWAKLSSDIDFRRLQLTLLKEILIELKQINAK